MDPWRDAATQLAAAAESDDPAAAYAAALHVAAVAGELEGRIAALRARIMARDPASVALAIRLLDLGTRPPPLADTRPEGQTEPTSAG